MRVWGGGRGDGGGGGERKWWGWGDGKGVEPEYFLLLVSKKYQRTRKR